MSVPLMQNSGRGTLKHFHKLAKKKPEIERMYTNICDFTEEEIEKAKLPKWVRSILLKEKEKSIRKEAGFLEPSVIADIMSAAHVCVDIGTFVVHKLTSDIIIGNHFAVEAKEGDLVAFADDGVLVNGIKKSVSKENALNILNNSLSVGDLTPEEYRKMVREYINEKF